MASHDGYLFSRSDSSDSKKVYRSTQRLSGQIADWLRTSTFVPAQLAPNHAFRHRFKTVGRELGIDERVLAAIFGHNGKTVGEKYGDVNMKTRIEAIDKFPNYAIS
jgi:site-specific recombinase XerD